MSKVLFSRQSGGVVTIHILNVSLLMVALLEWDFDDACPMQPGLTEFRVMTTDP